MLNTSTSIIDAIKAKGGDSSFAGRSALATKYGMSGYTGTGSQNQQLLDLYSKDVTSATGTPSKIVTNSATAQNTNMNNVSQLNTINAGFQTGQGNMISQGAVNNVSTGNTDINSVDGVNSMMNNINSENQKLLNEQATISAEIKAKYDTLKTNNDALYNKTIDNINARFDSLRTTLSDANQRFTNATTQSMYNINGFQYTPVQAESMVYQAETAGINKLQELEGERASAIIKANEAKQNDDARLLDQQMKLIDDNFSKRMKIIDNMQTFAKNVSSQIEASKKAQATAYSSMYKDIDQIVPYYNAMSTSAQKEQFIQEYATKTGADPEMIRSTLQNYTQSQKAYKQGISIAKTKTTGGTSTTKKTTTAKNGTQSGTVVNEVPDTASKREKELKSSIQELKSSAPSYFDKNGYLYPEVVNDIVSGLVAQGYPEKEVKDVLDGYIYDENSDGFFEKTATSWFGYKR